MTKLYILFSILLDELCGDLKNMKKSFDTIVIGTGHAGIEACLASARMGCNTAVLTMDISKIGLMPCNPAIGGPAKGQIVSEVDALGGEIGYAADSTMIQMKILNRSRGPAVQCLRSQNDKHDYNSFMIRVLKEQPNLTIIQAKAEQLIFDHNKVVGVITDQNEQLIAKSIVITTGTFLGGKMHTGLNATKGGRVGEHNAESLSESLRNRFRLGRLKTGTPPRLHKDSIDVSSMTIQPGDDECLRFSHRTPLHSRFKHQIPCYLTYTNPATHDIIMNSLDESPLFTKVIKGSGPRYCPSIEDKVVRFLDKESHQIFIEPEGRNTPLIYPQGLNTSLPESAQLKLLRTMKGLEKAEIVIPGYAVEYDFVYPDQLKPSLETKNVKNLFLAGQINGTSGYEEAAGQGIVAGINAALMAQNKEPLILKREESYIGTMIDDLITKEIHEPYRMMSSRSEFRLLFRQDNAIYRLSERGHAVGLISDEQIDVIRQQQANINAIKKKWRKQTITETVKKQFKLPHKVPIYDIIKRPEVNSDYVLKSGNHDGYDPEIVKTAVIEVKYEGYIIKQQRQIDKIKNFESKPIPINFDYSVMKGLKKESQEKFIQFKPKTIYDAKKIAGINPADISVLIMYLERYHHTLKH